MPLNTWWTANPSQRFWMETTGRPDVGTDLHAPALDDSGHESPTYSTVRHVADGDVVFHYEKAANAITSWSVAHGGFWEAETVWGTPRSTGPSGHPVQPYPRAGLWYGLHGPFALDEPLTLVELRDHEIVVREIRDALDAQHAGALYFPFQLRSDGLRGAQGYLFKMPAELVAVLPKLAAVAGQAVPPPEVPPADLAPGLLGSTYAPADEAAAQADRDPFPVDPAVVERGVRSHAQLQNALANHVASQNLEPRRPGAADPAWDLLWHAPHTIFVAEVKSLTARNEERQLRLGLGQLLRYRHALTVSGHSMQAVLMVEHEPTDPAWDALCDSLGILLVWPAVLAARL